MFDKKIFENMLTKSLFDTAIHGIIGNTAFHSEERNINEFFGIKKETLTKFSCT